MTADEALMRRAIKLAREARRRGDHPFGALLAIDGEVVLTARNTVHSERSPIAHAETNLVWRAARELSAEALARSVLYTSCEPCAMCTGAMYWAGIRRLVYGLPADQLAEMAGPDFLVPCRELLSRAASPVEVVGPVLAAEARRVHDGFWP